MKIWLVTIGEPVPLGGFFAERLHRTGFFAQYLSSRGHQVEWWTSGFDHFHKKFVCTETKKVQISPQFTIHLLKGCGYSRNVSIARILDHRQISKLFLALAQKSEHPDIIVTAFPSIELAYNAVLLGRRWKIPVIVDIRDLWPDIFLKLAPKLLHPLMRLLIAPLVFKTRRCFGKAAGLWAVSKNYLDWGLNYSDRLIGKSDLVAPLGYNLPIYESHFLEVASEKLKEKGVDLTRTIVWFIGMFGRTYDLHTVIAAAEILEKESDVKVQFVLSGVGDSLESLKKRAISVKSVTFTGWLNQVEIAAMMQVAKIGIMAYAQSAPQGLPNKLFEFMATGLPICSSLEGEAANFLKENRCGLTYKAGSAFSLAETIVKIIADKENEMGQNGKRLFESKYDSKLIAGAMESKIEEIVSRSHLG